MYQYRRDSMRSAPGVAIALGPASPYACMKRANTGIGQQRHVAEEIMEHIRLDQVIELVAAADPHRDRKSPVRQVIEEHLLGYQARHGDDAPAGGACQHFDWRPRSAECGCSRRSSARTPCRNSGAA